MELRLSKNSLKTTVNGRTYKMKKWSTIATTLQGMKLGKALAPSFAMVSDLLMAKSPQELALEEADLVTENKYLLTGAVTQLCASLEDDHFMDLVDKLLQPISVIVEEEAVELGDWSKHFDEHPEDFDKVLAWSFKVNLWDFFMKQDTFSGKIEMLLKALKPKVDQMQNLVEEGSNSK